MTDLTRLFAVASLDGAAEKAGFWKGKGYHVAVAGPTDAVRLAKAEDDAVVWESGAEADWYLVLASKAPIELLAAQAP